VLFSGEMGIAVVWEAVSPSSGFRSSPLSPPWGVMWQTGLSTMLSPAPTGLIFPMSGHHLDGSGPTLLGDVVCGARPIHALFRAQRGDALFRLRLARQDEGPPLLDIAGGTIATAVRPGAADPARCEPVVADTGATLV